MECHCNFYEKFSGGCHWGFRSMCCQAEVGIFNLFHVCASQFPALNLQNMVYLCFSEQLGALGAKALLNQGWLMWRKAGERGAHWHCCCWGGLFLGQECWCLWGKGKGGRETYLGTWNLFRNMSGLSDASPISEAAAGGWWLGGEVIVSPFPCTMCHCTENVFPGFLKLQEMLN